MDFEHWVGTAKNLSIFATLWGGKGKKHYFYAD
jgi:hypothetical protein